MKPLFLALLLIGCGILPAFSQDVNIDKIIQIESSGNPNAYNATSGAIGLCQITPIVLKEYENRFQSPLFLSDLYNPSINKAIGSWYLNDRIPQMLKAYKIPDTIDNRLACYNEGIGNLRKGKMPKETRNYIKKYHKLERGD